MKRSSSFEKLSQNLSRGERSRFLKEVENHVTEESPQLGKREDEERGGKTEANLSQLKKDLRQLTGFRRLTLRLLAYFRGKSLEEVFQKMKLDELEHSLRSGRNAFVNNMSSFNKVVAERLHPVYLKVKLLRRLLHYIWGNNDIIGNYYRWVILNEGDKFKAKNRIDYFVSIEEIQEEIKKNGQNNELKRRVSQLINRELEKQNPALFKSIKLDLIPIFYLRTLFQFPFADFFQMFGCAKPNITKPSFGSCPRDICAKELLKLYSISEILRDIKLDKEKTVQLLLIALEKATSEKEQSDFQQEALEIFEKLEQCVQLWKEFIKKVPLLKLVCYSQKDPYYTHQVKTPVFQIRQSVLREFRSELLQQFDELWKKITEELMNSNEERFISDSDTTKLSFYSKGSSIDPSRFGCTAFSHYQSVSLLANFLLRYYPQKLRPSFIHLAKSLAKRSAWHTKLLTVANGYENISRQLKDFNASLAPETDRGKRLGNIMYRLEKGDVGARVPLLELIKVIDEEVRYLLEKSLDNLNNGKNLMSEISEKYAELSQQQPRNTAGNQQLDENLVQQVSVLTADQRDFWQLLRYNFLQESKEISNKNKSAS